VETGKWMNNQICKKQEKRRVGKKKKKQAKNKQTCLHVNQRIKTVYSGGKEPVPDFEHWLLHLHQGLYLYQGIPEKHTIQHN
jgi:hypothetical protein